MVPGSSPTDSYIICSFRLVSVQVNPVEFPPSSQGYGHGKQVPKCDHWGHSLPSSPDSAGGHASVRNQGWHVFCTPCYSGFQLAEPMCGSVKEGLQKGNLKNWVCFERLGKL